MTVALACCVGIAAIAGWPMVTGAAAKHPVELASRLPETRLADVVDVTSAPESPSPAMGKRRSRARCAECAVVESVRRIEAFHALTMSCDARGPARLVIGSNEPVHPARDSVESLGHTVALAIAGEHRSRKVVVSTRHRIVLRFGDGSKQVLDEATARSLKVGEQVMVIAGSDAKAFAGIQTTSMIDQ